MEIKTLTDGPWTKKVLEKIGPNGIDLRDGRKMNLEEVESGIEDFARGRRGLRAIPSGEIRMAVLADVIGDVGRQQLQASLRYLEGCNGYGAEFKYSDLTGQIGEYVSPNLTNEVWSNIAKGPQVARRDEQIVKNSFDNRVQLEFSSMGLVTGITFWEDSFGKPKVDQYLDSGLRIGHVRVMATVAEYNNRKITSGTDKIRIKPELVIDNVRQTGKEFKKWGDFYDAFDLVKSIK